MVDTIRLCGLRAVINIPKVVSPLPVVDHYGVRARAIPPFPTFPIASSPPGSRPATICGVTKRAVRAIHDSEAAPRAVGPDNLMWP